MNPELANIRAKLVASWEAIPDSPPRAEVPELLRRAHGLVDLIDWIDQHPKGTLAQYREALARVKAKASEDVPRRHEAEEGEE